MGRVLSFQPGTRIPFCSQKWGDPHIPQSFLGTQMSWAAEDEHTLGSSKSRPPASVPAPAGFITRGPYLTFQRCRVACM